MTNVISIVLKMKSRDNEQIRAEDANLLNLQCDDYPDLCIGLSIYCPS